MFVVVESTKTSWNLQYCEDDAAVYSHLDLHKGKNLQIHRGWKVIEIRSDIPLPEWAVRMNEQLKKEAR